MGFHITDMQLNVLFQTWQTNYHIYAPRNFSGGGRFSDTDCIRYGKIEHANEIVFDKKSDYSFKEVLTTITTITADEMVRFKLDHRRGDHVQKFLNPNITFHFCGCSFCFFQRDTSCSCLFSGIKNTPDTVISDAPDCF